MFGHVNVNISFRKNGSPKLEFPIDPADFEVLLKSAKFVKLGTAV